MLIKGKFNSDYVKNRRKNPQSHRLITWLDYRNYSIRRLSRINAALK
jgi:hypothetical protein